MNIGGGRVEQKKRNIARTINLASFDAIIDYPACNESPRSCSPSEQINPSLWWWWEGKKHRPQVMNIILERRKNALWVSKTRETHSPRAESERKTNG